MEKRTKGQQIEYAIFKAVSEYSFVDWLETWGIKEEDWDKFMDAGKAALHKSNTVTNKELIDFCNNMGGLCGKINVRISKNVMNMKLIMVVFLMQKIRFIQTAIQMK